MEAGREVKINGNKNDLIERIVANGSIGISETEILNILKPENFTGRASQQVDSFIKGTIKPILQSHKDVLGHSAKLHV
jgi:adenylosuccinate lyase